MHAVVIKIAHVGYIHVYNHSHIPLYTTQWTMFSKWLCYMQWAMARPTAAVINDLVHQNVLVSHLCMSTVIRNRYDHSYILYMLCITWPELNLCRLDPLWPQWDQGPSLADTLLDSIHMHIEEGGKSRPEQGTVMPSWYDNNSKNKYSKDGNLQEGFFQWVWNRQTVHSLSQCDLW